MDMIGFFSYAADNRCTHLPLEVPATCIHFHSRCSLLMLQCLYIHSVAVLRECIHWHTCSNSCSMADFGQRVMYKGNQLRVDKSRGWWRSADILVKL